MTEGHMKDKVLREEGHVDERKSIDMGKGFTWIEKRGRGGRIDEIWTINDAILAIP